MKSKKLIAILTVVALMMTLVPMAAFATADTPERLTSSVTYSTTSVEADGATRVKVTVALKDDGYNAMTTAKTIYFASNRGTIDTVYTADDNTSILAADAAGNAIKTYGITTSATGTATFYVQSKVSDPAKFAVGIGAPAAGQSVYDYLVGASTATEYNANIITSSAQTINFVASTVGGINASASAGPKTANGADYYDVTFTAKTSGGAPIANATMYFTTNKNGVTFNKTEAITDANGQAVVKVFSTKASTYAITGYIGSIAGSANVTFGSGSGYDVALIYGGKAAKASSEDNYYFVLKMTDAAGNVLPVSGAQTYTTMKNVYGVDFSVITKPTDSAIDVTAFTGGASIFDATNLGVTIPAAGIKKEGDYVIRAYLNNGKSVDIAFTSKKQGTVTGLTLLYLTTSLPHASKTGAPIVKWVDAEGVTRTATASNLVWSVSDPTLVDNSVGKEINTVGSAGVVYATTNTLKTGSVDVTVVDTVKKVTASATLKIGVAPVSIAVTAADAVVGETKVLDLLVKDGNGDQIAFGESYSFGITTYTVLSKPAGAVVTVEDGTDFATNLKRTGKASVKLTSNKAGDVKFSTVFSANDGTKTVYYSTSQTVAVKDVAAPVVGAAKSVTMFIGAKGFVQDGAAKVSDVAPFLKDNRTFVEVRALANAFGVKPEDIKFENNVVTLVRSDMTVTIAIGGAVTKIVGGVSTTVVSDVPAFITAESRTVLPFRAVGEAFGYTVGYDAATQAVSYSL